MVGIIVLIILIAGVYIFGTITNKLEEKNDKTLGVKIISFIVPLVGFIFGAINLSKENEKEKELGMNCVVLGILSCIVFGVLYFSIV